MPCYKGDTKITQIYKPNTTNPRPDDDEIAQVYKGEVLVYTNNTIIYLGEAQEFNVASVYPDYQNLTVDNFFILSTSTASATRACPYHAESGDNWTHDIGGLEKSYNKATGKLTCRLYATAKCATIGTYSTNYAKVKAVLVSNPEKLVYLGKNTTFILSPSEYPNYANYTVNHFLIKTLSAAQPHSFNGATVNSSSTVWLDKRYSTDSRGGVLACSFKLTDRDSRTYTNEVVAYLCKPGVQIS